ncbi:YfzA family protein [Paenibacillus glacialis]|uniref:YfzA-like protein n=1 Tax=Paenibacillus glacialis TaxID=494026 RepID=A0A168C260_9BACL|nr:YfzA family protein [Paenibacillus glacialis]OAB32981.1 hypothetical protein PGLA_26240 [Paenibacillus glacialis]
MNNTPKKDRPILKRVWMFPLGLFLVLQLFFIVCEVLSWAPNLQDGEIFTRIYGRISNSKLFTEWFVPYKTTQFNIFTAIFSITLLPTAFIVAIKDFYSRK